MEVRPSGSVLFRQSGLGSDALLLTRGAAYVLAARREARFDQGGYPFLAAGSALLEQDGALISTRAPALVELRHPVKVMPQAEVRALLVPAV